ncbi:MAG: hypothetical protein AAGA65_31490 [Actinomycetota bacterium]
MFDHQPPAADSRNRWALQPLDPYPEHLTRYTGVRQHTELTPSPDWEATADVELYAPLPVVASLPSVTQQTRPRRLPWASTGLYALGQVILAAVIAFDRITPQLGLVVCLLWLVCGLVLIAAQVVSGRHRLW